MRLLVTRPAADAARTAAALRARGHEPILAPLLDVEIMSDADLGAGPWAAILVTSANAVRAVAGHKRRDELRGIAVFTVGDRSAQAMRDAGFHHVTSAGGNVTDLARLVARPAHTAGAAPLSCRRRALRRSRRAYCAPAISPWIPSLVYRAVIAETAATREPPLRPASTAFCISRAAAPRHMWRRRATAGLLD